MIIALYVFAGIQILGGLSLITAIGKPRPPLTARAVTFLVAFAAAMSGVMIAAAITLGHG